MVAGRRRPDGAIRADRPLTLRPCRPIARAPRARRTAAAPTGPHAMATATASATDEADYENVLVTGFGPFGVFAVNPSWLAVRELDGRVAGRTADGRLARVVARQLPVEYAAVSSALPALWQELDPCLAVHVGVDGYSKRLFVEACAHNGDYVQPDTRNALPRGGICVAGGSALLKTGLDADAIARASIAAGVGCGISWDAGNYLCDFCYYCSLTAACTRAPAGPEALFVHVPPLNTPYSLEQLVSGLQACVAAAVAQVRAVRRRA